MECVFGKTVYTGSSVLKNAYVAFSGSKITSVSNKPSGDVLGKFKVLTPAFIDPHCHIGMRRAGEPGSEGESNERIDTIIPVPDALDSVQLDDASFRESIEMGVLYSCVVPGSGNVLGGKSAFIRNYAKNTTEALITRCGIKGAFGWNPMSTTSWKGTRPTTRMGNIAHLRKKFDEVLHKMDKYRKARGRKKDEIHFNTEEEIIRRILEKRERFRVHVHKIDDIAALLRVVDEYKIRITVEHACDVHEPGIYQELKRRKIPVTYGPVEAFAYKTELKHENWRNVEHLMNSGVEFGLMTDHPVIPQRNLFLQTRWFSRFGFTKQDGIELVTAKNAKILKVTDRLGTLAKGKWASIICWSGDPYDITSYPKKVIAEGKTIL